jgi:glutathione S-transferase
MELFLLLLCLLFETGAALRIPSTTTRRTSSSTSLLRMMSSSTQDVLYDVPVSNHGARIRIIIKEKGLQEHVLLVSPQTLGGLKSSEYIKLNPYGKMPLLVGTLGGSTTTYPIPESDTIAKFLLEKYASIGCSMQPEPLPQRLLCDQLCRSHDTYISPIQACMYRAPGSVFGLHGTDRTAALAELKRVLLSLEDVSSDESIL